MVGQVPELAVLWRAIERAAPRPSKADEKLRASLTELALIQAPALVKNAEGYRRIVDQELEIDLYPHRLQIPERRHDAGPGCAFCQPPPQGVPDVRWRGYRLFPNIAPYVPAGGLHLIVSSEDHRAQTSGVGDIRSMIELSRRAGDPPVTLHFNGLAGNSQFHFHWQLTTERLPLERALKSGRLPLVRIRKNAQIELSRYELGLMRGLLLRGSPAAVQRWSAEIIRRLDTDPLCQGHYNLLLLPSNGEVTLAIIPRRYPGAGASMRFGGMTYGGRMFLEMPSLDAATLAAVRAEAIGESVDPQQLEWISALRRAPEPTIVEILQGVGLKAR